MKVEELPDGTLLIRKNSGPKIFHGVVGSIYCALGLAIGWSVVDTLADPVRMYDGFNMVMAVFAALIVTYHGTGNVLQALDDHNWSVRRVQGAVDINGQTIPVGSVRGVVHERVSLGRGPSYSHKVDLRFNDGRRQVLAWYIKEKEAHDLTVVLARVLDLPVARRNVSSGHAHLLIDRLPGRLMRLFRSS